MSAAQSLPHARARRARGRRRALAAAALALSLALATAAHAQLGDPGTQTLDTDVTPVAKESERWQRVAGAAYSSDGPKPSDVPEGSVTPFEADLFTVSFYQPGGGKPAEDGFAGGAVCREPVPAGASPEEAREHTDTCERVPVIYRYSVNDIGEASWEEIYRGTSRGYVGAIDWISEGRALAVGGTGEFPRREHQQSESDPAGDDVAEAGRAWLYENGAWRELSDLPAGMRGMSALDVSPRPSDCGPGVTSVCAVAGGFRQLWMFEDGAFTGGVSDQSPDSALDRAYLFQFRVRDISFARSWTSSSEGEPRRIRAVAATAGCCAADELKNGPRLLIFDSQRWYLRQQGGEPSNAFHQESQRTLWPNWPEGCIDTATYVDPTLLPGTRLERCGNSKTVTSVRLNPVLDAVGAPTHWEEVVPGEPDEYPPDPDPWQLYQGAHSDLDRETSRFGGEKGNQAESFYAILPDSGFWGAESAGFRAIMTPGGPTPGGGVLSEPASRLVSGSVSIARGSSFPSVSIGVSTSTLRIHDFADTPVEMTDDEPALASPASGELVGVLKRTGQGAALGPQERLPNDRSDKALHDCDIVVDEGKAECDPDAGRFIAAWGSRNLFKLPSYALNSVQVTDDITGAGWAVGDHGAILGLAGQTAAQAQSLEPAPPRLGQRKPQELPNSDAYDAHRQPLTDEPGIVPPYGLPGTEQLREPRFVSAGHPSGTSGGPASTIVMSRDGSEGWAFGSAATSGGAGILYRYDGAAWKLCALESDPACAGIASVLKGQGSVTRAARVPLENDGDPSNDDELEIVALAKKPKIGGPQRFVLRYRDGRWALDEEAMDAGVEGHDVVFSAPDDGWVVSPFNSPVIYHFDGERWMRCSGSGEIDPDCDDPNSRLSAPLEDAIPGQASGQATNPRGLRLAVAGERVYAFGTRRVGSGVGGSGTSGLELESYPMIIYRDRGESWTGGIDESDDGVYNPTDGGWDPGLYASGEPAEPIVKPPPTGTPADNLPDAGAAQVERVEQTVKGADEYQGRTFTVSVAVGADGVEGWALGLFGGYDGWEAEAVMMRLEEGRWRYWSGGDAIDEYLRGLTHVNAPDPRVHLTLPHAAGARTSFIFKRDTPALAFNEEHERWEALPTPWIGLQGGVSEGVNSFRPHTSRVSAVDGEGGGGFWAAGEEGAQGAPGASFYHYTDRPPKPVFQDVPLPARNDRITALAPATDGSLWLGDERGFLYRYDRLTGWNRGVSVPGWDPPRSTRQTPVNAIALGSDGRGVAVGNGGRIAEVGPDAVGLDQAAGTLCDFAQPTPPCGTGRDLNDAAVAPDDSAFAVGDAATLLWRPAGEEFRRVEPPRLPRGIDFTKVEFAAADEVLVLTSRNQLLRGGLSGGAWSWSFELGTLSGPDPLAGGSRINDFAIDADGHGYAIGDDGVFLERREGEPGGWRTRDAGYPDDLQAVALPTGGGEGLLIGANGGVVLTLVGGGLEVARPLDGFDPVSHPLADVGAMALVPGMGSGQVEAWILLSQGQSTELTTVVPRQPQALLHHATHPDEPLLDPTRGAAPLPDAPPPRSGELSFAAFGKQDCQTLRGAAGIAELGAAASCVPGTGSNLINEEISERTIDELLDRAGQRGGPQFSLFTGDAADSAGGGSSLARGVLAPTVNPNVRTPVDRNAKHRRWVELVADRLADGGLPIFGALGGQDLALHPDAGVEPWTDLFFEGGLSAKQPAEVLGVRGGLNLPWRSTMATMPAPWERTEDAGSVEFERLGAGPLSQELPDAETPEVRNREAVGNALWSETRLERISIAGAPTHYATDVIRDGEPVARIVVADTSVGSLAASNPGQHPIEVGGQERWLEEVLCFDGSATDTDDDIRDCTREQGQLAIVLTNTPTYTYGPIPPDETMRDAAAFEAIMLRNQVNVVVSGRLGWNGLYWATAPGVHEPCPGQGYQTEPPKPGVRSCGQGNAELDAAVNETQGEAQELADGTPIGTLPFVVSSTAGGRFNERAERTGTTTAENGFWRGYSIVRLAADGDPQETIVEQRPILDWVGLEAGERELEPRGTVRLEGYAREAFGIDTPARYIEIASPAITHRYDLLLADPDEPWVPCEAGDAGCEALYTKLVEGPRSLGSATGSAGSSARDDMGSASRSDAVAEGSQSASATATSLGGENPCDPYLCLPERVGTVDSQSGEVRAGNGKYPDTFAIGMLSVGDHVATYPLVFKRSPSFIVNPAVGSPAVPSAPTNTGTAPAPPAPPNPPTPNVPQVNTPAPPPVPPIAPLSATQPPEPQPPAPPTPPPPTEQPAPLSLTLAPPSIAIATPTAVIQPPTPPVNPAPPGGARREARQRQAAAQKSGADSEESGEGADDAHSRTSLGNDPSQAFARANRRRPEPSFTALAAREQPSAWAQGALYTGGIALAAFALAAGFSRGRPTPRQRPPEVPAPAYARRRSS